MLERKTGLEPVDVMKNLRHLIEVGQVKELNLQLKKYKASRTKRGLFLEEF